MFLFQIEMGHYVLWLYFLHCSCANKISNGFNKNYTDNLTEFFLATRRKTTRKSLCHQKLPEKAFAAENYQKKPVYNWKKKIHEENKNLAYEVVSRANLLKKLMSNCTCPGLLVLWKFHLCRHLKIPLLETIQEIFSNFRIKW